VGPYWDLNESRWVAGAGTGLAVALDVDEDGAADELAEDVASLGIGHAKDNGS
jgi:hypothetical protein